MARIIALDYGLKRTGLAVTDEDQIFAFGLTTVPTHQVLQYLEGYFRDHSVEGLVIGEPRDLRNKPTHGTALVAGFVKQLEKKFPHLVIHKVDERFTSKIAGRVMIESGMSKKQRQSKTLVDKISATIILQSWLESREMSKKREE